MNILGVNNFTIHKSGMRKKIEIIVIKFNTRFNTTKITFFYTKTQIEYKKIQYSKKDINIQK
jgi:hypothetical protein